MIICLFYINIFVILQHLEQADISESFFYGNFDLSNINWIRVLYFQIAKKHILNI